MDIKNGPVLKMSVGSLWLLASFAALMLPIFLPTFPDPQGLLQNAMGAATAGIYVLAFPLSLFGIPLLYVSQIVFGTDPASISGKYLNLFMVFVLGLIQWFWIVPRLFRASRQEASVLETKPLGELPETAPITVGDLDSFRSRDETPLERVLRDD